MPRFSFHVNDEPREIDADGAMPLLWALRDLFGLTGTKYGCGTGDCGSCTVHVDGRAQPSCVTELSRIAGKRIRTIEGLSADGDHPLQRAWQEHDVPQCGYCQTGQIMAAAALLEGEGEVDDAAIDDAMSGNLCRCGTYQRIRAAIHTAAKELRP
jgi:isoquinoline 1-oxidoreductase alpha subunit